MQKVVQAHFTKERDEAVEAEGRAPPEKSYPGLDGFRRQDGEDENGWMSRLQQGLIAAKTPRERSDLYEFFLDHIGIPETGVVWPVRDESDTLALMRSQGMKDEAFLTAELAPEWARARWAEAPGPVQTALLQEGTYSGFFVGPDGELYSKSEELLSDKLYLGTINLFEDYLAHDYNEALSGPEATQAYLAGNPEALITTAMGLAGAAGRLAGAKGGGRTGKGQSPADPRAHFTSDADFQSYQAIKQSGVPLGFGSKEEVEGFTKGFQAALATKGVYGSVIALRGSAVTGRSYNTKTGKYDGHAFDQGAKPSDWDVAIINPRLYDQLKAKGVEIRGGGRTVQLNAANLREYGFPELADRLEDLGREASIMVYQSERAIWGRGPWMKLQ